jgi:mandelamide amidase
MDAERKRVLDDLAAPRTRAGRTVFVLVSRPVHLTEIPMVFTSLSRRAFLEHASGLATLAAASAGCRTTPRSAPPPGGGDLTALSATAAAAAMRNGDMTAEAYATALLERAEQWQHLNAFRVMDRDAVLAAARSADKARASGARLGLLHGLPVPVKDSVNTAAYPTSNGARALEHFRAKADAAVLGPLLAQGAYVMGKTNLHELSFGFTSTNAHFGAVRNPYNAEHVPGGSSGGSGAAVAARMAPLAIAEDTAGSIRCPAGWCGIAGMRPTYGRYPDGGIMPLTEDKFDQVGAVARRVEDLVLFDTVITGDASPVVAAALKGVRIGVPEQLMTNLAPDVERVTTAAFARLEAEGVTLVRVDMPEVLQASQVVGAIVLSEWVPAVTRFLEEAGTGVTFDQLLAASSDEIKQLPRIPREAYEGALQTRAVVTERVRARFAEHRLEALAYPPLFECAPKIGDTSDVTWDGRAVPRVTATTRGTTIAPCCGHPGLILPAGLGDNGLPSGLEFDGLAGADRQLLGLGLAVEQALGPIPAPKPNG